MARLSSVRLWGVVATLASGLTTPACLDLDAYELVPGAGGSYGAGGGTALGGTQGAGGSTCTATAGTVLTAFRTRTGGASAEGSGCAAPEEVAGVDVMAFDGTRGRCESHIRLSASDGAAFTVLERVRVSMDGAFAIAGTLRAGTLTLPLACGAPMQQELRLPDGGGEAAFVIRLSRENGTFCTSWARLLVTNAPGTLVVTDVDQGDDGSVAIAGTLGGGSATLNDGASTVTAEGGAFLASLTSLGRLRGLTTLKSGPAAAGAALGLGFDGASWMAAGAALLEDPACHDCGGASHVTEAARACGPRTDAGEAGAEAGPGAEAGSDATVDAPSVGAPDASSRVDAGAEGGLDASVDGRAADASVDGRAADASSADEAGSLPDGAGVTEASRDAPAPGPPVLATDAVNAFVLRAGAGLGCGSLDTFGSDVSASDPQAAFDVAPTRLLCGAYVTGLAGAGTFRLEGTDPGSELAPGTDGLADAFLARFSGGRLSACGAGGHDWSLRITTTLPVSGTRVRADGCDLGSVTTFFAEGRSARAASVTRCESGRPCEAASSTLTLGDANDQAAIVAVTADGELEWHLSVGPLVVTDSPAPGSPLRLPSLDLAGDGTDDALVLFDTARAPVLHNVRLSSCEALNVAAPAAGLWLVKLDRDGVGSEAMCRFAVHLGASP